MNRLRPSRPRTRRAACVLAAAALSAAAGEPPVDAQHEWTPGAVREQLAPLSLAAEPAPASGAVADYLSYYRLDVDGIEYHLGSFESGGYRLAAQVFRPPAPRATVILLHGYLDHTGTLADAIRSLLAGAYTVAIYDQPGHGLSAGERASIEDFASYVEILREFRNAFGERLDGPLHLVAFSMGGAVALDYLLNHEADVGRVVLVAPLVRSRHWHLSRFAHGLAGLFVDSVPRAFRETSSNPAFLTRLKRDPLQPRTVPLQWFEALVAWHRRVQTYPSSTRPVKIIQGTADSIVAWRYNLTFLQSKLPHADVTRIEGGRHHLLNERPQLRERAMRQVIEYLSAGVAGGESEQHPPH